RGPRYTITWTFPNGAGTEDKVRPSVCPYAAGGPLTFMAPGQRVLEATTKGGWFRSTDSLRLTLIGLGLLSRQPLTPTSPTVPAPAPPPAPAQPTTAADPGPGVWPRVAAGLALLLVVAAAGALGLRRRANPGAATTPQAPHSPIGPRRRRRRGQGRREGPRRGEPGRC